MGQRSFRAASKPLERCWQLSAKAKLSPGWRVHRASALVGGRIAARALIGTERGSTYRMSQRWVSPWYSQRALGRARTNWLKRRSEGCLIPLAAGGHLEDSGSTCWWRKVRPKRHSIGHRSRGILRRWESLWKKQGEDPRTCVVNERSTPGIS